MSARDDADLSSALLLPERFGAWFAGRGWAPRAHQLDLLRLAREGRSALLVAPTGAGKTLAGFLPSLVDLAEKPARKAAAVPATPVGRAPPQRRSGLHTLYISPLKALAVDVARNLYAPAEEMGLAIRIETRTGDTPASKRQRQRSDPPEILLTTPEQLALLLASADAPYLFGSLKRVVLDELHALVTSKRGDLLSLGLARLFTLAPDLQTVGLSATVKDPADLARFLTPQRAGTPGAPWSWRRRAPRRPCRSSRRRNACPGRAIRRGMRRASSMRPSRRTGRRLSSSTPAARRKCCSSSCGPSTRRTCPSPCITARSTWRSGGGWRTPWRRAS
jgi:ATP-dependent Lhr-like helicase